MFSFLFYVLFWSRWYIYHRNGVVSQQLSFDNYSTVIVFQKKPKGVYLSSWGYSSELWSSALLRLRNITNKISWCICQLNANNGLVSQLDNKATYIYIFPKNYIIHYRIMWTVTSMISTVLVLSILFHTSSATHLKKPQLAFIASSGQLLYYHRLKAIFVYTLTICWSVS